MLCALRGRNFSRASLHVLGIISDLCTLLMFSCLRMVAWDVDEEELGKDKLGESKADEATLRAD